MTRQEALNLVTIPSSTNRADRFISVINAIYDEVEQLEAELAKKEQIYNTVVTHDSLLIGILKAELANKGEVVVQFTGKLKSADTTIYIEKGKWDNLSEYIESEEESIYIVSDSNSLVLDNSYTVTITKAKR